MATSLRVTPAGNRLFQVEIHEAGDDEGQPKGETATERTVEVGVPDAIADLAADKDLSLQDLAVAAVRRLLGRQAVADLPGRVDLLDVADREPGFVEAIVAEAEAIRADGAAPSGAHTAERDERDSDERLVDETRQAQAEGQASSSPQRF